MKQRVLTESTQLMVNIIYGMHDPVFAIDLDGTVIVWNEAMEALSDVSAGDMLGKRDYEYALPFYGKRRPMLIDRVLCADLPSTENCHYQFIEKSQEVLVAEIDGYFTKKKLHLWAKANVIYDHDGAVVGAVESIRDITFQKRLEHELQQRTRTLEETNTALKALLQQIEGDRDDLEEKFLSNICKFILPSLETIKTGRNDDILHGQIELLEQRLKELTFPFVRRINCLGAALTPKQLQVAGLVRDGKSTAEIAYILEVSRHAVDLHRKHIRRKLGLNNKKTNLRSYLLSLT